MAQKQIKAVTISRSLHINYIRRAPIGWAVWEPANQEPSSCVAAVGAHSWDRGPQRDSTAYCFVFDPKTRILETVYSHFHRILPKHNSIKPHRIAPFTRKMRSFTLKSRLSSKSSNISQSRFTSGSYPAGSGILLWIRDLLRIRDHTTDPEAVLSIQVVLSRIRILKYFLFRIRILHTYTEEFMFTLLSIRKTFRKY